MPFKFNPFTGSLDFYESAAAGSGDVNGPVISTDKAITRWNGTTGKVVNDSFAILQDGGAIQSQGFLFNNQIIRDISVPDDYVLVGRNPELISGNIVLLGSSEFLIL